MMIAGLLALVVSGAPAPDAPPPAVAAARVCGADAAGFCTAKVVRHPLSYVDGAQRLAINAAVGDVISLEFPAGVERRGEPALGNSALFAFQATSNPFRVLVWPRLPKGARNVHPEDLEGVTSSLQVFLDSGVAVLVDLKIGPRDAAVQRVVFDFPARERESDWVQTQLSAQARKLRAQFEEERAEIERTVVIKTERAIAHAVLERNHCERLYGRAERGLLIVWGREICRMGRYTLIRFEVENRYRDLFHVDRVEVHESEGQSDGPLDVQVEWQRPPRLPFDARVAAVAIFVVDEGARSYRLKVFEDGGKKRVVELDDVEF